MQMQRQNQGAAQEQPLVRFGLVLANWSERWFPDPLIFALLGIVVVFVVGLLLHQSPNTLAIQGGKNFWSLVNFTMQMVMIIIGGYVVASTPIVLSRHSSLGWSSQDTAGSNRFGGVVFDADVSDFLGLEPDFQRPVCSRTGESREGNGLSCRGGCRLSRSWSSLGDGIVVFRRNANGDQGSDATILIQHQRSDPAHPNPIPVAEHCDNSDLNSALGDHRIFVHALAGKRENRAVVWH